MRPPPRDPSASLTPGPSSVHTHQPHPHRSAKKKYSNHYSSKHDKEEKEYDDDEDEKSEYKSSHKKYGSSHKPSHAKSKYGYGKEDYEKPHKKKHVKPLPPGKYPKGYATAPPGERTNRPQTQGPAVLPTVYTEWLPLARLNPGHRKL